MKKFILIFMIAFFAKNLSAQAIYCNGCATVCADKLDSSNGEEYTEVTYTVNHPVGCNYCITSTGVTFRQDGLVVPADNITTDCSVIGAIVNRVSTVKVRWGVGAHNLIVTWIDCGFYTFNQVASYATTVTSGTITNTSGTLTGTSTSPLYPEPYVCDNNLSNFNINTNLSVGSCAATVTSQMLYLDRRNSTTGVWSQGIASSALYGGSSTRNMVTIFGLNNLTGVNNQNIYRVRGVVTSNAPGTKTFTTPKFRVASIGAYNVDYFYTNTQGQNIPLPASALCSSPIPVSKFDSPVLSGVGNTGIIDKYWIKIYDATGCPLNPILVLDGSTHKRVLPNRTLGDIISLQLNAYYRQIKTAQGVPNPDANYFPNNPNKTYRIELYGENVCTGASGKIKLSFIQNSCLTCRTSTGGSGTDKIVAVDGNSIRELAVIYPNPVNEMATLQYGSPLEQRTNLYIYDMQGRVVSTQILDVAKGENSFPVSVADLPKGLYAFKIGETSGKFIKE